MEGFVHLKLGTKINNSPFWKLFQIFINLTTIGLPILTMISPDCNINPDKLATIITTVGAMNVYLTTATTEEVGL